MRRVRCVVLDVIERLSVCLFVVASMADRPSARDAFARREDGWCRGDGIYGEKKEKSARGGVPKKRAV